MELTEGRVLILLDRSRIFRHRGRENGCLSEIWIYSATRGGAGVGRSSHMFITSPHLISGHLCPELSKGNRQFFPTIKA